MSLALIGKGASYEFRWRRWALLRDTLAMHVEDGRSGSRFPRLAEIGSALASSSCKISASELAAEVAVIKNALAEMPIAKLAIGEQTATVLYPGSTVNAPRVLTDTELAQVVPVGDSQNLAEYFSSMLECIADVCKHPADDGTIEVVDG